MMNKGDISDDEPKYNTDIKLGSQFVNHWPLLLPVLVQDDLIEAFEKYDTAAKSNKFKFQSTGAASVFIGATALIGITWELYMLGAISHGDKGLTIMFESLAILSILLAIFARIRGYRNQYRINCYKREKIRLWRFQLFLDGELVSGVCNQQRESIESMKRKWEVFLASLDIPGGDLKYMLSGPERMHCVTTYPNDALGRQAFEVLKIIRFEYQAGYTNHRTEPDPPKRIPLPALDKWSEAFARMALIAALILPASHLIGILLGQVSLTSSLHVILLSLSIVAIIISATARAFRNGMTLPGEIESYDAYNRQVEKLIDRWKSADTTQMKQSLLEELELYADAELKRFLIMKSTATFIV